MPRVHPPLAEPESHRPVARRTDDVDAFRRAGAGGSGASGGYPHRDDGGDQASQRLAQAAFGGTDA